MVVWCLVLFGLGAVAFLDTQYNYGLIFRQVNAVMFMIISLALLYRITVKARIGARESLLTKLKNAQQEIDALKSQLADPDKHQSPESRDLAYAKAERRNEIRTA